MSRPSSDRRATYLKASFRVGRGHGERLRLLAATELTTFKPFDPNFPFKLRGVDPVATGEPGCASAKRDIIKCDVRVASQAVDIPGTPLTLAYTSARAAGAADRSLRIPVTGAVAPVDLVEARVRVWVAGQMTEQFFQPGANIIYQYTWDGLDAYGRPVQGNPTALVEIGYRVQLEYQIPADRARSYGLPCGGTAGTAVVSCVLPQNTPGATDRFTTWRTSTTTTKLGGLDAKAQGLGGFDFNVHHVYDPTARVLYLGDGTSRIADAITPVISTVAGKGLCGVAVDNVAATKSCLIYPAGAAGVVALPDGGFLVPDQWQVRRVRPDGIIERFAGLNQSPNDFQTGNDRSHNPDGTIVGEGGPATQSYVVSPGAMAVGPDGTVYIADGTLSRIVRVAPNGILTRVLGKESGPWVADHSDAGLVRHADGSVMVFAGNSGILDLGATYLYVYFTTAPSPSELLPRLSVAPPGSRFYRSLGDNWYLQQDR